MIRSFIHAAIVLCLLVSCATTGHQAATSDDLRKAAESYWKLRMSSLYEDAYKMEDEADRPPYQEYVQRISVLKKLDVVGYSLKRATVQDVNSGEVEVEISMRTPRMAKPMKQLLVEKWVFRDGRWLHKL